MYENPFIRAFVAVPIDDPLRATLADLLSRFRDTEARVRWVPEANLHLSLAFLGNTARDDLSVLANALNDACRTCVPTMLEARCIGSFGSPRSPRVLWVGVAPDACLMTLQARVRDAIEQAGYPLESRPYHPHITLGRVKHSRGLGAVRTIMEARRDEVFGQWPLREVLLMQSRLDSGGAVYAPLHHALLDA